MRTYVLKLLVMGVGLVVAAEAVAGDRTYHPRHHNDNNADEVIYSLTVPWPFRPGRDAAHAAAVSNPSVPTERMTTSFEEIAELNMSNIHFATDRADLSPESCRALDRIGRLLTEWPDLRIELAGHCDSRGSVQYNEALSIRRAKAARNYLLKYFSTIAPSAVTTVGRGKTQPVASNDSDDGRARNRRVEFKVLNAAELAEIHGKRVEKKMVSDK